MIKQKSGSIPPKWPVSKRRFLSQKQKIEKEERKSKFCFLVTWIDGLPIDIP